MKPRPYILLIPLLTMIVLFGIAAFEDSIGLRVTTSGVLQSPTNFFTVNASNNWYSLTNAGYGSAGSGLAFDPQFGTPALTNWANVPTNSVLRTNSPLDAAGLTGTLPISVGAFWKTNPIAAGGISNAVAGPVTVNGKITMYDETVNNLSTLTDVSFSGWWAAQQGSGLGIGFGNSHRILWKSGALCPVGGISSGGSASIMQGDGAGNGIGTITVRTNLSVVGSATVTNTITAAAYNATTNSATHAPDFGKSSQAYVTNNGPLILSQPIGIDNTKYQEMLFVVKGSGTEKAIDTSAITNIQFLGTWNVTNLTEIKFACYGGLYTNATATPRN